MKAKIYLLSDCDQEAHFPEGNTMIAVCWNTRPITRAIRGQDGLLYKADTQERKPGSKPYIDFMTVRKYEGETEYVKNEESSVAGGLSIKAAERVSQESLLAIKYAKEVSSAK